MTTEDIQKINFSVDKTNLYREEGITDLKVASIRRMVPILPDGSEDGSRSPIFVGATQLMSPEGPVPIQASIQAATLEEALEAFPEAMRQSLSQVIDKARQHRHEEASRIIVPGR
ncbi:MAG: cytoplasmic protein [Desulfobacterales bacterium]|nr:cytoplasmic protein [Desulfobacterales bacterium]